MSLVRGVTVCRWEERRGEVEREEIGEKGEERTMERDNWRTRSNFVYLWCKLMESSC